MKKYALQYVLIIILITPLIVKSGHHHNDQLGRTKSETEQFFNYQEPCFVCQFEYSVFRGQNTVLNPGVEFLYFTICRDYPFSGYENFSGYIFQLRAPPHYNI